MTVFEGEAGLLSHRLRQRSLWALAGGLGVGALLAGGAHAAPAGPVLGADLANPAGIAAPGSRPPAPSHHRHKPPPVLRSSPAICPDDSQAALSPAEVTSLAQAAAGVIAAPPSPPMTVAVVDPAGNLLALYPQPPPRAPTAPLPIPLP